MPDNLPHVTPSRMPDQHSLTGSNISSGSMNGTLTSSVNTTFADNVNTSYSNNLSVHLTLLFLTRRASLLYKIVYLFIT